MFQQCPSTVRISSHNFSVYHVNPPRNHTLPTQFTTVCFSGPLGQLSSLFEDLSKSLSTGDKSPGHPATPLLFSLALKLHLLDPENGAAMLGFERGDVLSSNEAHLMNIEAMRRLSLSGWPHRDYQ